MSFWTAEERSRFGYIELDGVKSPGVLTAIELGDGIPLKWDVQQGWGLGGALQIFRGVGLAEGFSLTFALWTNLQRSLWDAAEWQRAIEVPPLGVPSRRRSIKHPVMARLGIAEVTLLNYPPPVSEAGRTMFTFKMNQWRKRLPQFSKPNDPDPTKKSVPAKTAADRKIEANAAQIRALAAG